MFEDRDDCESDKPESKLAAEQLNQLQNQFQQQSIGMKHTERVCTTSIEFSLNCIVSLELENKYCISGEVDPHDSGLDSGSDFVTIDGSSLRSVRLSALAAVIRRAPDEVVLECASLFYSQRVDMNQRYAILSAMETAATEMANPKPSDRGKVGIEQVSAQRHWWDGKHTYMYSCIDKEMY